MHITEGIITGPAAVAYTAAGVAAVGWGLSRMKKFAERHPEKKPLLGMGGALIFFISLIPIPAFTGTCSHPCGTPLVAILLGPWITVALAGISLFLQAAFFAHGGFSTWGANVVNLGVLGGFVGWGAFRAARKAGLPLWVAGFAGGFLGNIMVYAGTGIILGTTLANGPAPQYSLSGYLVAIYGAYLPTQLPIAVGEMLVTGLALQYAFKQNPEVLREIGIIDHKTLLHSKVPSALTVLAVAGACLLLAALPARAAQGGAGEPGSAAAAVSHEAPAPEEETGMAGMDEAVNEAMAEQSGLPPRDPYINTEAMGDVWNALLLLAGGICGFIVGRWWHILWGGEKRIPQTSRNGTMAAES